MKKKFLLLFLVSVAALGCAFGFAACGTDDEISLKVAAVGEEPFAEEYNIHITYDNADPDLGHKLYACHKDGRVDEIAFDDKNLSVEYLYNARSIDKLPDRLLAGEYMIVYAYSVGKSRLEARVLIDVARATGGDFTVAPERNFCYLLGASPDVALKNADGKPVLTMQTDEALKPDDTNGDFGLYVLPKDVYLGLTDEQKFDYDFMDALILGNENIWTYFPGAELTCPVGEFMLFAVINKTYNYRAIVTPATPIYMREPFEGRTFTVRSVVASDVQENIVTDENNDVVVYARELNERNQGKTVIFKTNGEVRGTADIDGVSFNDKTGDAVVKYDASGITVSFIIRDDVSLGSGYMIGDTLTIKLYVEHDTYYLITLIGD